VNVRPVVHGPVDTSTGGMVYRLKFPTQRVLVRFLRRIRRTCQLHPKRTRL
jgi:hypothetical protein